VQPRAQEALARPQLNKHGGRLQQPCCLHVACSLNKDGERTTSPC
jgi:hypothetical protein